MLYFIQTFNLWKAPNRKADQLQDYVKRNCEYTLVEGRPALMSFIDSLCAKVDELNALYPRTKELRITFSDGYIACVPAKPGAEPVFAAHVHRVRHTIPSGGVDIISPEPKEGDEPKKQVIYVNDKTGQVVPEGYPNATAYIPLDSTEPAQEGGQQ